MRGQAERPVGKEPLIATVGTFQVVSEIGPAAVDDHPLPVPMLKARPDSIRLERRVTDDGSLRFGRPERDIAWPGQNGGKKDGQELGRPLPGKQRGCTRFR